MSEFARGYNDGFYDGFVGRDAANAAGPGDDEYWQGYEEGYYDATQK